MMNEQHPNEKLVKELPEAVFETQSDLSIVWLIPLVALLIGAWLAYKTWSELGPTVTISFNTAEGLEAEQTKIRYKNVEIGKVEAIGLSDDLSKVIVTASLVKDAEAYLTENTRFWIVRARVAAGEVSGLGTLLSGAYIGIDPGKGGDEARHFSGLETPPIVTDNLPGRHFVLRANDPGSIDLGSPLYYRRIKVGQVVSRELNEDGKSVTIKAFINAPHDQRVNQNTRFWNASGIDVSLTANGIDVNTESLVTLMTGGISFETPAHLSVAAPVQDDHEFILYEDRTAVFEKAYTIKSYYVLYFSQSVRGLSIGAPVEFRGILIGEVTDIGTELDPELKDIKIPVTVGIEPDRFTMKEGSTPTQLKSAKRKTILEHLVNRGLRAQLKTGNYLTGQLFIDLDFHTDAPPEQIVWDTTPPVFPTNPPPLEEITNSVTKILAKLEKLPLDKFGTQFTQTIETLNETMKQTEQLARSMNTTVAPAMAETLEQTRKTLSAVENTLSTDSPVNQELGQVLAELSKAARSIRVMADYLERHPDAIIYGKKGQQ